MLRVRKMEDYEYEKSNTVYGYCVAPQRKVGQCQTRVFLHAKFFLNNHRSIFHGVNCSGGTRSQQPSRIHYTLSTMPSTEAAGMSELLTLVGAVSAVQSVMDAQSSK